jgi:outer membrane protein assembly factor BamE (lipoprotein component of BamABCDE complex)
MRSVLAILLTISVMGVIVCSTGCSPNHNDLREDKMTVGTVQREITVGMSSAAVVEALGSPNVVSTDENRREVWVYDKFATDVSAAGGHWTLLLVGQQSGHASKSQRTLTIIIKFDEEKKVRDFAYHASRF